MGHGTLRRGLLLTDTAHCGVNWPDEAQPGSRIRSLGRFDDHSAASIAAPYEMAQKIRTPPAARRRKRDSCGPTRRLANCLVLRRSYEPQYSDLGLPMRTDERANGRSLRRVRCRSYEGYSIDRASSGVAGLPLLHHGHRRPGGRVRTKHTNAAGRTSGQHFRSRRIGHSFCASLQLLVALNRIRGHRGRPRSGREWASDAGTIAGGLLPAGVSGR